MVGFESWLERDHAILLDFDPQVRTFASQPFWLHWRDVSTGRTRTHAPDFFARLADGGGLVIDCRPADRVEERSAVAFTATRRACESVGWRYRLVGEIDPVPVVNLRWLAGYRHGRYGCDRRRRKRYGRRSGARHRSWRRPRRSATRSRCYRWCSICCGKGCSRRICPGR
ncbi:TnsA-like heteromeric transposase endonuclease subunit [Actinoplanes utahensis]|uniref:TnsA-like heteromeric transposase endonuclease subunit n=1 Tax=Actinoplanes utahensis TaxID=1869 RepID=UPI001F34C8F3|nr:TnsA-like heteromeric transposase endonuclease subunit [Actinoplanes utahensis]